MKELTEFQKRILAFIEKEPNEMASTWDIAQVVFPEKWKKRSARGALIKHIDERGSAIPGVVRLAPKDRWAAAVLYKFTRNES